MTPTHRPARRPISSRAFTLAEGLIATTILSIATVGILTLVSSAAAQAQAVREDTTALSLARELLELTAGAPFATSATVTGFSGGNTNASTYDDIRDFNNYTDTVTPGDATAGDVRPYARLVTVSTTGGPSNTTDFRVVSVTVTPPSGRTITLTRLVSAAEPTRAGT